MSKTVYLDTTILGERFCGRPERQSQIELLLDTSQGIATGYVLDQFRATFLAGAVLLHNRLKDRSETPGQVPRPWRDVEADLLLDLDDWTYAAPREGARARMVLSRLIRTTSDGDDLRRTLVRWIELELNTIATDRITTEDATRCKRTANRATARDGIYDIEVSCALSPKKPCVIEEFWGARKPLLVAVANLNPPNVPDIKSAKKAAMEVIQDDHLPRGRRCWVHLSDAVIAAEARAGASIATTNIKDFGPLVQAMNEQRETFNPCKPE